jgi:ABC-type multidrug transport system permease subunit
MMEKTSPAYMRNFFLPVSKTTFVLATYLTNLILIAIQVVILLGISLFFLGDILLSLPAMALILFIAASVFTFLGMAVGYVFQSEETAVLGSISLGSLLLFVSGIILPIESMSPLLRDITSFNPFVLAEKLIREVFIFQSSFQAIWVDLLILVAYAFFLFLFIMIIESVLHEHILNRTLHQHHARHRDDQRKRVL